MGKNKKSPELSGSTVTARIWALAPIPGFPSLGEGLAGTDLCKTRKGSEQTMETVSSALASCRTQLHIAGLFRESLTPLAPSQGALEAWCALPIDSLNEILAKIFLFYAIKDPGESRHLNSPCSVSDQGQREVAPRLL